ncbi:BZ3500_MvSof-1268-A1-R1_Chr2-1g04694 [Microbotryum saponariae]|uniref:Mediator of RNA polymerase II transcription subunit 31 n=1 Tax=Microbotryum saponariae TaxID=289078 RepID=A0A2X0KBQ6_9BASI|nr:BZ3500_MvSof-1268-A1-R1_Chr2-1g04694 [Microbotryum saponariae]SCZ92338.1 BZ3501_MvSof-1269-A2-R1_Chr2-1g04350 [Microbotryum saponariae]
MAAEASQVPTPEQIEKNQVRFETELEFVQALANPWYLHSLAQQGHLDDPTFLNYLAYLAYFQRPRYARFVHYPLCLQHLDLLKLESFRHALKDSAFITERLAAQQLGQWATWRQGKINGTGGAVGNMNGKINGHGSHAETKEAVAGV